MKAGAHQAEQACVTMVQESHHLLSMCQGEPAFWCVYHCTALQQLYIRHPKETEPLPQT